MSVKSSRQMWAIKSRGGWLSWINGTRRESIEEVVRGSDKPWAWWKRKYCLRAVKVKVREL